MPLVSVIIPIFNSENFIARCAESLFQQSLKDIEYIFIDDASTDHSIEILESVIECHPDISSKTIIIREEENRGQAAAFRKALDVAKGKYVIKCDSDDTIEASMYEDMYSFANSNGFDVVICDMMFIYPDGKKHQFLGRINGTDDIKSILGNRIPTSLCNRLVKRNLFFAQGFRYPSANMCEDFVYSLQLAYYSQSSGYIAKPYYSYYRHPASFTWNGSMDAVLSKHNQTVQNITAGLEFLKEKGLDGKYKGDILRQCLFVKNGLKNQIGKTGIYPIWRKTFKESNVLIPFCAKIPFKERMVFLLIYFHLYGFYKYIKEKVM